MKLYDGNDARFVESEVWKVLKVGSVTALKLHWKCPEFAEDVESAKTLRNSFQRDGERVQIERQ